MRSKKKCLDKLRSHSLIRMTSTKITELRIQTVDEKNDSRRVSSCDVRC